MTHEWEELHTVEDDPRGTGMPHPVYVDIDKCSTCNALRFKMGSDSYSYMRMGWASPEEPDCHE